MIIFFILNSFYIATVIQLQDEEYTVSQNLSPSNISTSITIPVLRFGDTRKISKVRVSTIDGSATSGMDYYAKSKVISFFPGLLVALVKKIV